MRTFIATFHAWKKDDIATFACFLFCFNFFMKWWMGHRTKFGFKTNFLQTLSPDLSASWFVLILWCSFCDACWIYSSFFFFFVLEVFFQCIQRAQSSNDSPELFDLNLLVFTCSTSNEYFYNRVAQCSWCLLSIYFVKVKVFFHWTQPGQPSNDSPRFFNTNPLFRTCNE